MAFIFNDCWSISKLAMSHLLAYPGSSITIKSSPIKTVGSQSQSFAKELQRHHCTMKIVPALGRHGRNAEKHLVVFLALKWEMRDRVKNENKENEIAHVYVVSASSWFCSFLIYCLF